MSINSWNRLSREFQDAATIHAGSESSAYLFPSKERIDFAPGISFLGIHLQSRTTRKLRPISLSQSNSQTWYLAYVLSKKLDAADKFISLAKIAGQMLFDDAGWKLSDQASRAAYWIIRLCQWLPQNAIAFITSVVNGQRIDDVFTASARMIEAMIASKTPPQPPAKKRKKRSAQWTKKELNATLWRVLDENPGITIRKLAERLDCSTGLICQCPAWKERPLVNGSKATEKTQKAINLSEKLLAITPDSSVKTNEEIDDELDRQDKLDKLIAESNLENRNDPSPVDYQARRKPRQQKTV